MVDSIGIITRRRGGRIWIKDVTSGYVMPLVNYRDWENLGSPEVVVHHIGFALVGPRGRVIRAGEMPAPLESQ